VLTLWPPAALRLGCVVGLLSCCGPAHADGLAPSPGPQPAQCEQTRPAVLFNRWQEDWSVLASPCLTHEALDSLKFIQLGEDPADYLSLGLNWRDRIEGNDAALFGIGHNVSNSYLIQRVELHADARWSRHWQAFVQVEDARSFGKHPVTPIDRNPVDLEQAFIAYVESQGAGTLKLRVGRQEMAFDLQRFIAVRDGPNVRQAFDAVWADYELYDWRFIGYITQPVQYRNGANFDDSSNHGQTFDGLRVERHDVLGGDLSGYWSRLGRSHAQYTDGSGAERRDVWDLRHTGTQGRLDWDIESMAQTGAVGAKSIRAWALGSIVGFRPNWRWSPRVALQFDVASGDSRHGDARVGTFNPLFPNGYYFTLAGYTGYSNVVHLKPSIALKPASELQLLAALGLQWRQTTADAVYQQGNQVVPGTAGVGNRWTGLYAQCRADWTLTRHLVGSVELVHFRVGNTIRGLGGRDADYIGVELKAGW